MGIVDDAVTDTAESILPFWIAIPLKALGGAKAAIGWLIGSPVRWLSAALVVALLAAWHFQSRAVANAEETRAQAAQFRDAQAKAQVLAVEAIHHEEAVYQAQAQEADNAYQSQMVSARAAADRYISAHRFAGERVQPATVASGSGPASGAPEGGSAAVPASMPAGSVVVSPDDVQACTAATTYALKAHDWAIGINP